MRPVKFFIFSSSITHVGQAPKWALHKSPVHKRMIPQGECLGDIQVREPQSGWDGVRLVMREKRQRCVTLSKIQLSNIHLNVYIPDSCYAHFGASISSIFYPALTNWAFMLRPLWGY